jgi:hypothetical protein
MGNRFGRNQRRRMRAEIEAAQQREASWHRQADMQKGLFSREAACRLAAEARLAHIVETISRLCPDSALLPANAKITAREFDHIRGVIRYQIFRPIDHSIQFSGPETSAYSERIVDLNKVEMVMHRDAQQLGTHVALRVADKNEFAYALSDSALAYMEPEMREHAVRRAAEKLIEGFEQGMKERRMRAVR